jgi:Predicted soluble lytic transglycosylase fused to an ABC-type amino acid-binding protein
MSSLRTKIGIPLLVVLLLILGSLSQNPRRPSPPPSPVGDTLFCAIAIKGQSYRPSQHPVGYHYRLLQEFAQEQHCALRLLPLPDSLSVWEALLDKTVNLVALDGTRDTIPEMYEEFFITGLPLNEHDHVWVFRKEDFSLFQSVYGWFNNYRYSANFATLTDRFYPKGGRRNANMYSKNALSPYDDIIKEHARSIGWDWRLLASLIYQESMFRMGVSSSRGAVGLMQIRPSIAKKYGVDLNNMYDPSENIRAGSSLLRTLGRLLDGDLQEEERVKFILAAYNAGIERIKDCRNFAASQGKNPNSWEEVAQAIPLMREEAHYNSDDIQLGRFKGDETLRFVEGILERYHLYCEFMQ